MDTDNLSKEAYEGIILEADKFNHDLTLCYGLLSSDCKNESEYLDKAENFTQDLLQLKECELKDVFVLSNSVDKKTMNCTLNKILLNIEKVKTIPYEKKNFKL